MNRNVLVLLSVCIFFPMCFGLTLPAFSGEVPSTSIRLENCGTELRFVQTPRRALTINQNPTEVMLSLGLGERMVGTAYLDDAILEPLKAAYDRVPVIASKYPSREVVLGHGTDFIYAGFAGAFTDKTVGAREDLLKMGIRSYISPAFCGGSPSSRFEIDVIYDEILDIGRIFDVEERARTLVESMRRQIQNVREKVTTASPGKRVFLFDTWGTDENVPFTGACCGPFNLLIELAGGRNIFSDIPGRTSHVTWEAVIERDPEVIILDDAWWSPAQKKLEFLRASPALSGIKAVRESRFAVVPASGTVPGVRFASTVEDLAKALYPERFQ